AIGPGDGGGAHTRQQGGRVLARAPDSPGGGPARVLPGGSQSGGDRATAGRQHREPLAPSRSDGPVRSLTAPSHADRVSTREASKHTRLKLVAKEIGVGRSKHGGGGPPRHNV